MYWNSKSYTELEKLAQSGDAEAQYQFGSKLDPFRLSWQRSSIAVGNKAAFWLSKAARQGHFFAKCKLLKDFEISLWEKEAETLRSELEKRTDSPNAKYFLSHFYAHAIGGARKEREGHGYKQQAAEEGNVYAMGELDSSELLQQAAMLGYAEAQWKLAKKNESKPAVAIKWYREAAARGNVFAQNDLLELYQKGIAKQEDLLTPLNMAVDLGYPESINALGVFYLQGDLVQQDYRKGYALLEQATNKGLLKGEYNLASCLYNGIAVDRNFNGAMQGYQKAAEKGERRARAIAEFCKTYGSKGDCEEIEADKTLAWQNLFNKPFEDIIEFRASSENRTAWQRVVKNTANILKDGFLLPSGKTIESLRHECEGLTLEDIIQKVAKAWKSVNSIPETGNYLATPWETRALKEGTSRDICIGMLYTLVSLGVQPEQIRIFWDSDSLKNGAAFLAVADSERIFWLRCGIGKQRGKHPAQRLQYAVGLKIQQDQDDDEKFIPVYYHYAQSFLANQ